jgi:hypothetical protein
VLFRNHNDVTRDRISRLGEEADHEDDGNAGVPAVVAAVPGASGEVRT